MTTRAKLNLFAAAIIAAGATALTGPTPAQAAESFGPCDTMNAALQEAASECWARDGAVKFTYSGYCGADGWNLQTNCYVQMM